MKWHTHQINQYISIGRHELTPQTDKPVIDHKEQEYDIEYEQNTYNDDTCAAVFSLTTCYLLCPRAMADRKKRKDEGWSSSDEPSEGRRTWRRRTKTGEEEETQEQ